MERKIITTSDGSHSIAIPEMKVTYRSIHGAIQESLHVFIDAGLGKCFRLVQRVGPLEINFQQAMPTEVAGPLHLLEMGFGTGLNALLTLIEADKLKHPVHYTALELFPLSKEEVQSLNYCEQLNKSHHQMVFEKLHQCEWGKDVCISPFFTLHKSNVGLPRYSTDQRFNLIYFDAFAPASQPELWTKEVFEKLYSMMYPGGILVTYCSKGDVRRAMQAAGFGVEKIPGPRGKREMLRARK
ncbi:MAG: tRNA (5-methylaminomethyl-2-thiouridine)(34)-methyltransferase MnmD [Bacteroidota bacterium]|nr:tRNA (5-methylaminomethyl-2-thiouridine)(34)-methyltransferase MnmD [Bacteroidota bacterium]